MAIIIICMGIFFLIRNEIVLKLLLRWGELVYDIRIKILYKNMEEFESLPSYEDMRYACAPQWQLVFHPKYWLAFNIEDCIKKRDLYNLVMDLKERNK